MAGANERKTVLVGPLQRRSVRFSVGKNCAFPGASVVATLPDPLFMQFLQEFSLRQGVGGGQSGLKLGFVWEFWYIGGWGGAGLGMEEVGVRGGFGRD
jgi:hypothetical protein